MYKRILIVIDPQPASHAAIEEGLRLAAGKVGLRLIEQQGLSFAEAAARLRTTPQAVKTRVCRTRALLKAKLG